MDINTRLTFGKYKGKTVKEIQAADASYVQWMLREGIIAALPPDKSPVNGGVMQDMVDNGGYDTDEIIEEYGGCFLDDVGGSTYWGD